MNPHLKGARSLVAVGRLFFDDQAAIAQSNTAPPTTATRPASAPEQNSLPKPAPRRHRPRRPPGEASRDPKVKEMNENEKEKVERQGK